MVEELPHGGRGVGELRVLRAGGDSKGGQLVSDIPTRVVGVARYIIQREGRGERTESKVQMTNHTCVRRSLGKPGGGTLEGPEAIHEKVIGC